MNTDVEEAQDAAKAPRARVLIAIALVILVAGALTDRISNEIADDRAEVLRADVEAAVEGVSAERLAGLWIGVPEEDGNVMEVLTTPSGIEPRTLYWRGGETVALYDLEVFTSRRCVRVIVRPSGTEINDQCGAPAME